MLRLLPEHEHEPWRNCAVSTRASTFRMRALKCTLWMVNSALMICATFVSVSAWRTFIKQRPAIGRHSKFQFDSLFSLPIFVHTSSTHAAWSTFDRICGRICKWHYAMERARTRWQSKRFKWIFTCYSIQMICAHDQKKLQNGMAELETEKSKTEIDVFVNTYKHKTTIKIDVQTHHYQSYMP